MQNRRSSMPKPVFRADSGVGVHPSCCIQLVASNSCGSYRVGTRPRAGGQFCGVSRRSFVQATGEEESLMSGNQRSNSIVRRWRILFVTFATLCLIGPASASATTLFVSGAVDDVIHRFDAATGAAIMPDIPLLSVTGLATGPNGDLFAVSSNPPQVYRYNPTTGAQIGGPYVSYNGQNDGHDVFGPTGMAFAPNGNLYIAETTASNVHVYDTAGNSVASMDSPELSQP